MKNSTNEITFRGRQWRLLRAAANRLVFVRADADAFRAWRHKGGLTQREAAALLGVKQPMLAKIELGARSAPPGLLEKLSRHSPRTNTGSSSGGAA